MIYTVLYSETDAKNKKLGRFILSAVFNVEAGLPQYRDLDTHRVFEGTKAFSNIKFPEKQVEAMTADYKKQYPDMVIQSKNAERQSFVSKLLANDNNRAKNLRLGF